MDDDQSTDHKPGEATHAQGSAGGPSRHAPGGGQTGGSREPDRSSEDPPEPGDETARAATGDIPALDAASAGVEPSTTGNPGIGEAGTSGPAG